MGAPMAIESCGPHQANVGTLQDRLCNKGKLQSHLLRAVQPPQLDEEGRAGGVIIANNFSLINWFQKISRAI